MKTQIPIKNFCLKADYWTSYSCLRSENSQRVLILLHGYKQRGCDFYRELEGFLPEKHPLFIPNGPYPVPKKSGSGHSMTFSWYFYDSQKDVFIFDMELALNQLEAQLVHEGFDSFNKVIVGFSQGGYLAPFLARRLTRVEMVCGIHSRYRVEDFESPLSCPIYSIHGADDPLVECSKAKKSFEKMLKLGHRGQFFEIPGLGHQINEQVGRHLMDLFHSLE